MRVTDLLIIDLSSVLFVLLPALSKTSMTSFISRVLDEMLRGPRRKAQGCSTVGQGKEKEARFKAEHRCRVSLTLLLLVVVFAILLDGNTTPSRSFTPYFTHTHARAHTHTHTRSHTCL
jgi:hypothetical protein